MTSISEQATLPIDSCVLPTPKPSGVSVDKIVTIQTLVSNEFGEYSQGFRISNAEAKILRDALNAAKL